MVTTAKSSDEGLELKLSLFVCLVLSGGYVIYEFATEPRGGHPVGHWLGIIGTLLMLSTEVLYSLRKRTRWLKIGPVRHWLSAHIITGIVGPFMVLLHSAFEFHGLAGFSLAVTLLVVASGFIGRYLYTAIPHSLAGTAATANDLAVEAQRVRVSLEKLAARLTPAVQQLLAEDAQNGERPRNDWALVLLRGWEEWRYQTGLHHKIRSLEKGEHVTLGDIERLLVRRHNLTRQMQMMPAARRLLSIWHIAHVPMGVVLFGSAAIHTLATLVLGAGAWH